MKFKLLLILILLLGFFFRSYQFKERFMFNHDSDLSSWIVKDIVVDNHIRLIGQLTSAPGIFIGPYFYYSLIPFYLIGGMDPLAGVWLSVTIGILSIISIYFVFSRLYDQRTGLIAALVYAVSFGIVLTEREVVPTTPVFLWSIWFFYAIKRLFQGYKSSLLIFALLFSLIWSIHLALALLFPLVFLGFLFQWKKFKPKDFVLPLIIFIGLSLPLGVFELRHNFIQTKALASSLSSAGSGSGPLLEKIERVYIYSVRNINFLAWEKPSKVPNNFLFGVMVFMATILFLKRIISWLDVTIFILWYFLFLAFFALHPINLSEYYINGLNILWIAVATLFFSWLIKVHPVTKTITLLILTLFLGHNLHRLLTLNVNHSGYVARKAITEFIASDAAAHNYPCVAVSYMTSPGNEFGYRYLFWLTGLHVNAPKSNAPVYTIVFPHSLANRLDKTFGALGLIYPEHSRYTTDSIKESCAGENSNLTDPMFGFTR